MEKTHTRPAPPLVSSMTSKPRVERTLSRGDGGGGGDGVEGPRSGYRGTDLPRQDGLPETPRLATRLIQALGRGGLRARANSVDMRPAVREALVDTDLSSTTADPSTYFGTHGTGPIVAGRRMRLSRAEGAVARSSSLSPTRLRATLRETTNTAPSHERLAQLHHGHHSLSDLSSRRPAHTLPSSSSSSSSSATERRPPRVPTLPLRSSAGGVPALALSPRMRWVADELAEEGHPSSTPASPRRGSYVSDSSESSPSGSPSPPGSPIQGNSFLRPTTTGGFLGGSPSPRRLPLLSAERLSPPSAPPSLSYVASVEERGDAIGPLTQRMFTNAEERSRSESVEELLRLQKEASSFVDMSFPPSERSLYRNRTSLRSMVTLYWLRPSHFCEEEPVLFKNDMSASDIVRERSEAQWLVTAFRILATSPSLLDQIFLTKTYNEQGIYSVQLHTPSGWRTFVIDDFLPCTSAGRLAFTHCRRECVLWAAILEKAYAKMRGSYEALEAGDVTDALFELTSCEAETMSITEEGVPEMWTRLRRFLAAGYHVACEPRSPQDTMRVVCGISVDGDDEKAIRLSPESGSPDSLAEEKTERVVLPDFLSTYATLITLRDCTNWTEFVETAPWSGVQTTRGHTLHAEYHLFLFRPAVVMLSVSQEYSVLSGSTLFDPIRVTIYRRHNDLSVPPDSKDEAARSGLRLRRTVFTEVTLRPQKDPFVIEVACEKPGKKGMFTLVVHSSDPNTHMVRAHPEDSVANVSPGRLKSHDKPEVASQPSSSEYENAARIIQGWTRFWLSKRRFAKEDAATMIQALVRGWLVRRSDILARRRKAVAELRRKNAEEMGRRFRATILIQRIVRGWLARMRYAQEQHRRLKAALVLQSWFRVWRERHNFLEYYRLKTRRKQTLESLLQKRLHTKNVSGDTSLTGESSEDAVTTMLAEQLQEKAHRSTHEKRELAERLVRQREGEIERRERARIEWRAAKVLQRRVRLWLGIHRASRIASYQRHRKEIAKEILQFQRRFVEDLEVIVNVFLNPLRHAAKTNHPILPLDAIRVIFSDVEVILNYNKFMLDDVERKVRTWSPRSRISDYFLKLTEFLRVYTAYVNNYNDSVNRLSLERGLHPKFEQFLEQRVATNEDHDLLHLLIKPVQSISRYSLLLQEMIKHTSQDNLDFEDMCTALSTMSQIADEVNERKREAENLSIVMNIQSKLRGKFKPLVEPHRRFIREGSLTKVALSSKRRAHGMAEAYLFLFNDLLVYTRRDGKKKFRVHRTFELDAWSIVKEVSEDELPNSFELDGTLTDRTRYKLRLFAHSEEEKSSWVDAIRTAIRTIAAKAGEQDRLIRKMSHSFIEFSGDAMARRYMATSPRGIPLRRSATQPSVTFQGKEFK